MLGFYEHIDLINGDGILNVVTCPTVQAEILCEEGLIRNGEYQRAAGMTICPENMQKGKIDENNNYYGLL